MGGAPFDKSLPFKTQCLKENVAMGKYTVSGVLDEENCALVGVIDNQGFVLVHHIASATISISIESADTANAILSALVRLGYKGQLVKEFARFRVAKCAQITDLKLIRLLLGDLRKEMRLFQGYVEPFLVNREEVKVDPVALKMFDKDLYERMVLKLYVELGGVGVFANSIYQGVGMASAAFELMYYWCKYEDDPIFNEVSDYLKGIYQNSVQPTVPSWRMAMTPSYGNFGKRLDQTLKLIKRKFHRLEGTDNKKPYLTYHKKNIAAIEADRTERFTKLFNVYS